MSVSYQGRRTDPSQRGRILWLLTVAALLALAAAAVFFCRKLEQNPQVPAVSSSGIASQEPSVIENRSDVSNVAVEIPSPPYDFSQPVPQSEAVDNRYFEDAAFVGDSRTDGFMLYSGVGTGENLSSNGLSIFRLAERKALTIDGEKYTLLEALALKEYGKVYISLGINELGYNNDKGYYKNYCAAIDEIRRLQPKAVIYIQGLIPVNEEQAEASTGHDYLKNDHLRVYNDLMRQIAEEKQVAFLDLYSEFADENGSLPKEASRDGIHLVKESCQRWLDYLKTHTADFDALYPDGPPMPEPADPAPVEPDTTTADGSERG